MEGLAFHDGEQHVEILTGWLMVMDWDDFLCMTYRWGVYLGMVILVTDGCRDET